MSLSRKLPSYDISSLSQCSILFDRAEQLKIVTKRSRQETHSSHASGSGADEGTGVTPGVPDAPDYDSEDDISWKSSDEIKKMMSKLKMIKMQIDDDDEHDDNKKAQDDNDEETTASDNDW
ncbi:hypothetical protein Tco_1354352 [Tanacetum coccineum]